MALYGLILLYGSVVAAAISLFIYFYFTRNFNHWKKRGVPYIKPIPFVGNLKDSVLLKKTIGVIAKDIYDQHKDKPFIGIFTFDQPVLLLNNLDMVKSVLIKDFQNFVDRNFQTDEKVDPFFAKGLFGLKGERWRSARNSLSPTFTSGKMRQMTKIVLECGKDLISCLERDAPKGQGVPAYEMAARYTTDVIASCAFGLNGNNLKDPHSAFREKMRLVFELSPWESIKTVASFFAPKLVALLGLKIMKPEVEEFVKTTISDTVVYREEKNINRSDLLGSLIELKNQGYIHDETLPNASKTTKYFVDDEDIAAHSFGFLAAGFETSATTMAYTLYELALHPAVQDRLRKEILDTLARDSEFTYENLHGMKYLDMVLSETLRKYPPLPFLDRQSNKSFTLPGTQLTLEKGTRIMIPLLGFHMDEEYFPNPSQFDPDRYSDENKNNINKYAYMPFGNGPRNCIGMRFALLQAKNGIVHILKEFQVLPCRETPKKVDFNPRTFLLQPKHNIPLIFQKL